MSFGVKSTGWWSMVVEAWESTEGGGEPDGCAWSAIKGEWFVERGKKVRVLTGATPFQPFSKRGSGEEKVGPLTNASQLSYGGAKHQSRASRVKTGENVGRRGRTTVVSPLLPRARPRCRIQMSNPFGSIPVERKRVVVCYVTREADQTCELPGGSEENRLERARERKKREPAIRWSANNLSLTNAIQTRRQRFSFPAGKVV